MAETHLSTSNFKSRFWLTLLAFVFGLVVIDFAFATFIEANASSAYRQAIGSKSSFQNKDTYDIWIMGDSLAADGIVPSVLEAETGQKTYNWGINASSPFEWEILGRDLERRAVFPKIVVIGCNPHMFIKRPNDGPFVPPAIQAPDLQMDLMRGSVERADLSAILASGRKKLLWKGSIAQWTQGRDDQLPRTFDFDNGFVRGHLGMKTPPRQMNDALRFDAKNAQFQSDAFEKLVALCARNNARIALVKVPIHPVQLAVDLKDVATLVHYQKTINAVTTKYRCKTFEGQAESNSTQYSDADFTDAIHLSNRGADKFSLDLGRWLRVTWP